jgi:ABC-type glycerol-3-phosphate transport system substrate-binding protein
MMKLNLGKYSKFITGIVGIAVTILSQKYGGTQWFTYVVGAASALGIYGVPNTTVVKTADTEFRAAWEVSQGKTPIVLPTEYPVQPVAKQVQGS